MISFGPQLVVSPLTSRTMGTCACLDWRQTSYTLGLLLLAAVVVPWCPPWWSPFCQGDPCEDPSGLGFGQGYMALVSVILSFYCVSGPGLSLSIETQFAHLLLAIATWFAFIQVLCLFEAEMTTRPQIHKWYGLALLISFVHISSASAAQNI